MHNGQMLLCWRSGEPISGKPTPRQIETHMKTGLTYRGEKATIAAVKNALRAWRRVSRANARLTFHIVHFALFILHYMHLLQNLWDTCSM